MAKKWTKTEEKRHRLALYNLYIKQNKTINEVGNILGIAPQTVFKRLRRLRIATNSHSKNHYLNKRVDVKIPVHYSKELAEFFGIMLGDGKVSYYQVIVTLGNKEIEYVNYVVGLIKKIFRVCPKIGIRKNGHRDIYFGSVDATRWLIKKGLVYNKIKSQVDIPKWIFLETNFMKRFLRGFFDTDGSVYKLKHGIQISFTNKSRPMLISLRNILINLKYTISNLSSNKVYLTRIKDVERFFKEIRPNNSKHIKRFQLFIKSLRAGTEAVKRG